MCAHEQGRFWPYHDLLYARQKGQNQGAFSADTLKAIEERICAGLGFGTGFSVVYITMSAEQFGTNLRATAAISVPNMVRGALPLIILIFGWLRTITGNFITGAWLTGIIFFVPAIIAATYTKETFGKDLNFIEE